MLNDPYYRASQYPYQIPDRSYIMEDGTHRLVDHDQLLEGLEGRNPILAVGSNLSPQQLGRKFPGTGDSVIPVTKIHLRHFDSVYSTHFSSYGSIPATLFPVQGTEVSLFINWLNPAQESRMHTTEIASENYRFCRLNNIECTIDNGPTLDHLYVYLSSRGALSINGSPVPLSAIKAQDRRWAALDQMGIQDHARAAMAPDQNVDDFIHANISNPDLRRQRTDLLNREAIDFTYNDVDVIES